MAVATGAVSQLESHTATNGTLALSSFLLHPSQCAIVVLMMGDTLRLGGKARRPHLRQHIEVTVRMLIHQPHSLLHVGLWLCPLDIRL
jgi:hypothetical protein